MTALNLEHKPPEIGETRTESIIDLLRAGFADTTPKGPKHLDVPIPQRKGFGMRFIALDREPYDELLRSDDPDTNLDFIAATCECILVKDDNDKWRPATDANGSLVKFDGSLAEIAGWDVDSPRKEVLRAYGQVPQPYRAIAEHVQLVDSWMAGRVEQREEDLLGES